MDAIDPNEKCLKLVARGNISEEKHKASLFLINREFEQCIEVCHSALDSLRNNDNCRSNYDDDEKDDDHDGGGADQKEERSALKGDIVTTNTTNAADIRHAFSVGEKASDIEEFLVILVQALAELERWQEVLPYITDIYSSIENLPPNILKLCLLLHANVAEYSTCSAIFNIWRTSEEKRSTDDDLEMLTDIYVSHVLLPAGHAFQLTSFIMSSSLPQSVKEGLLAKYAEQGRVADSATVDRVDGTQAAEEPQQELTHRVISGVIGKAVKVLTIVLQWLKSVRLTTRSKVVALLAGLLAILLVVRNNIDYGNSNHYQYLVSLLHYFLSVCNIKR